ncbi:ACP S-malonyltransferase [Peribacillus sp. SCS-37]|uniref:ACP S-malonyltransferase n=1 Tax=Paraperibacillus esterisolvens TaxID=3115296 RepID=UPI003905C10F
MGKIAFVFPGQGSQAAGMGKELYESHESVKHIFDEADSRLGFQLSNLIFEGTQEELTKTTNAQPALLTMSTAVLTLLEEAGISPDYTAGHSLGEYSALVASGAFSFSDGVYAVRKRGEYMEAAVPDGKGSMAAVLGLDREKLAAVTENVSIGGDSVQLANINCPGQIVISGTAAGVQKAGEAAKQEGAKRVIPLEVSGPFHSQLMKPAAVRFEAVLDSINMNMVSVPVISNVTAKPMTSPQEIKERLIQQLYSPVLWEDSVRTLLQEGVDTFVEIGPGKVLSGLIKKIDRTPAVLNINDQDSLEKALEVLKGRK